MEVLHLGNGRLSLGGSGIALSQQHGPHTQKEIPSASNSMPFGATSVVLDLSEWWRCSSRERWCWEESPVLLAACWQ